MLVLECAEDIVVTCAMNAFYIVSAALAEDEIQQQFLRMQENIITDMDCRSPHRQVGMDDHHLAILFCRHQEDGE